MHHQKRNPSLALLMVSMFFLAVCQSKSDPEPSLPREPCAEERLPTQCQCEDAAPIYYENMEAEIGGIYECLALPPREAVAVHEQVEMAFDALQLGNDFLGQGILVGCQTYSTFQLVIPRDEIGSYDPSLGRYRLDPVRVAAWRGGIRVFSGIRHDETGACWSPFDPTHPYSDSPRTDVGVGHYSGCDKFALESLEEDPQRPGEILSMRGRLSAVSLCLAFTSTLDVRTAFLDELRLPSIEFEPSVFQSGWLAGDP